MQHLKRYTLGRYLDSRSDHIPRLSYIRCTSQGGERGQEEDEDYDNGGSVTLDHSVKNLDRAQTKQSLPMS